jgi:hypothetical protein
VTPITGLTGRRLVIDPTGTVGQALTVDAILAIGTAGAILTRLTLDALRTVGTVEAVGTDDAVV